MPISEPLEDKLEREKVVIAPLKKRALAYVIDDLLVSLLVVAIIWNRIESAENSEILIGVINQAFIEIIVLRIVYQSLFVWYYGATLGKIFLKIKVIDMEYLDRPTPVSSFARASIRALSEVLFYFGFIFAFFDKNRLTLHDRVSKTLVVDVS